MISGRDDGAKLGLQALTGRIERKPEAVEPFGSGTCEYRSVRKCLALAPARLIVLNCMIAASSSGRDPTAWQVPELGSWPRDDRHHHVVVVGAGIAGLSAGALLASRGCKVLVIEAHDGQGLLHLLDTQSAVEDGTLRRFVFDAGVQDISGLGPGKPLRKLLAAVGAEDRIGWRRVVHRYVQDGLCLDFPEDPSKLEDFLCRHFSDDARGITGFWPRSLPSIAICTPA